MILTLVKFGVPLIRSQHKVITNMTDSCSKEKLYAFPNAL